MIPIYNDIVGDKLAFFFLFVFVNFALLSTQLQYNCIIDHYNYSVRIIELVSYTTYAVCVNFIHKWRDLQFKVDSKQQIFLKTLLAILFLLSEFLPEIC